MSDERRRQAEQLFHEVVELSPNERAAYLTQRCPDVDVRAEVESLLAHLQDGTITSLSRDPGAVEIEEDLVGQQIGPYTIVQQIGEGGFGAVYLAEQEEPVRRAVALKIIKLGMDTKQVMARFEAERQALAMMDHPNIAKVLDAGATENGRPYFVMELVKGVPLTEYCDQFRLSARDRLRLFVLVCRAVQHAHQKGIIHRDLKPSNVLVMLNDGVPVPKVIDFGIAKATKQRLTELTLLTEFRQFIGTPQYMSPEQAEASGLDVDTRTDIYSLGVLLYELLTGTTPFDSRMLRSASYLELQRILREQDPPRPSARISALGARTGDVARLRRTEPHVLRRLIKGELDWIVMKALEKDRTRRYETAAEFAADVQRHLNNEPVHAGPPRTTYKLRKFIQRHRVGATAGAVVAAGLIVALALATTGFVQAREERDAADAAAERAQSISVFLQDMLAAADPMQLRTLSALAPDAPASQPTGGGFARDVSVAEMVRLAATRIDKSFAGKPELAASASETLGMTLRGLGLYSDAEPLLRRAYDIRRRLFGPDHPDALRSAVALGALLLDAGRGNEALPLVRYADRAMCRVYGTEDPRTLSCDTILASIYSDQNDYLASEQLFFSVLRDQRRVLGSEHRDTLVTMWQWSISYLSQWKLTEGEALAREVYEIAGRTLSPNDSLNILSKPLMGWWYLARYQYGDAEAVLRPGLAQCRRILGEQHPFTYMTMYALGRSLQGRELQAEKERLQREALAGLRATRGRLHWHTISTTANFANYLSEKGQLHEAAEVYRDLLADCRTAFGEEARDTLELTKRYADVLERAGRFDEAIAVHRERFDTILKHFGPRSMPGMDESLMLAHALVGMGHIEEARAVTHDLLEGTRQYAKSEKPSALALNNYAWFLLICEPSDMRDPNLALPYAQRAVEASGAKSSPILDTLALAYSDTGQADQAVEIQKQSLALLPEYYASNLNYPAMLVRYLIEQGNTEEADRFVREAVERFRNALGEDNPLLAVEFNRAGVWLIEAGHFTLAERLLRESLELNRELLGRGHEQVALTLCNLARLYHIQGQYEQAGSAYREALDIRRNLLGDDHLAVAETLYALGLCLHESGDSQAAVPLLEEAQATYRRLGIADIPGALNVERDLAAALVHEGRLVDASPLAEHALARTSGLFGPEHWNTGIAEQTVGLLRVEQGRPEEAEPLLRRSVETLKQLDLPAQHKWRRFQAQSTLGYCLLTLRRFSEAEPLLLAGYEGLRDRQGENFLETRLTVGRIVALYEAWGKAEQADTWRAKKLSAAWPSEPGAAR